MPQQTRSRLEERFLSVIRAADPPIQGMHTNVWIAGAGEVVASGVVPGIQAGGVGGQRHGHQPKEGEVKERAGSAVAWKVESHGGLGFLFVYAFFWNT